MIMAKWKCEICGSDFDNFHAQGFDEKIYCPLCFFKKENEKLNEKIVLQANALKEKDEMLNNRNGVIQHLNLRIDKTIEYITKEYYKEHTIPLENLCLENCNYEPSLVALSILKGKDVK